MSKPPSTPSRVHSVDFLDCDLSANSMAKTANILLPCQPELGVFFDGANFFAHCRMKYDYMDVITYTCQSFVGCPIVRRLIIGVSHISQRTNVSCKPLSGYKSFAGLHTKLYLGYRGGLKSAYVGSHNLVTPTLCEVIVRTNPQQMVFLAQYFEALWADKEARVKK